MHTDAARNIAYSKYVSGRFLRAWRMAAPHTPTRTYVAGPPTLKEIDPATSDRKQLREPQTCP